MMKIPLLSFFLTLLVAASSCTRPAPSGSGHTEFTVAVYNVENLFDVDGVAIFNDYKPGEAGEPFTYTRRMLLTKLENAAALLVALEPGGPDVILFQELEGDFTPESSVTDIEAFLARHADTTVHTMLTDGWQESYRGYPAVAWLAKAMADVGLDGYQVVVAPTKPFDSGIAHVNATFSRFPIKQAHFHEIVQARDIIEVELDVAGHSLWVYNNHWKAGASNPNREPIRVQNAQVLKALVEARLEADPQADIIIGGDLNSHYNHSILYADIQTGINDVLGSHYLEGESLYNLWYEVEPEQRYAEVWRGNRGTLMHLIVSPGLYDDAGVSYLDNSFEVGRIVGLNADAFKRPRSWHFSGETGGGTSDHFPLIARFSTAPFEPEGELNAVEDALDFEMRHDDDPTIFPDELPDGSFFGQDLSQDPGALVGRLHAVQATVLSEQPLRLKVAGKEWAAYAPAPHVREQLKAGLKMELAVSLGYWKGEPQLVVAAIR
ncbi:MAG: endonuclease/exonuclease/phosphatase family protein [Opitutales bacterium]